jgi:peptide deformylase
MAIREIITPANPVLRQKARKVTAYNAALKTLVDDMVDTMRVAPGVGLAAPQVAMGLRVIVVEYAETPDEASADGEPAEPLKPKLYKVINPEIAKASEETALGAEGCLSLPGYGGEVPRHTAVTVKGFNLQGKPIRIKAEGWLARIFQHEIDHLDGILFIDRATRIWKAEPESRAKVPEAGDA